MAKRARQNIDVPDEIWQKIRERAAKEKVTMSEFAVRIVCQGLNVNPSKYFDETGKYKGVKRRGHPGNELTHTKKQPKRTRRTSTD